MPQASRSGFLKLLSRFACACVPLPPRLLIVSGMMWHDVDPIWLTKHVLMFYTAAVVSILVSVALALTKVLNDPSTFDTAVS